MQGPQTQDLLEELQAAAPVPLSAPLPSPGAVLAGPTPVDPTPVPVVRDEFSRAEEALLLTPGPAPGPAPGHAGRPFSTVPTDIAPLYHGLARDGVAPDVRRFAALAALCSRRAVAE